MEIYRFLDFPIGVASCLILFHFPSFVLKPTTGFADVVKMIIAITVRHHQHSRSGGIYVLVTILRMAMITLIMAGEHSSQQMPNVQVQTSTLLNSTCKGPLLMILLPLKCSRRDLSFYPFRGSRKVQASRKQQTV